MTEDLVVLSDDIGYNTVIYEAATYSTIIIQLYDSDGNMLVFNEGGNWVDDTGSQMIDNSLNNLIFGGSPWAGTFVNFYSLGSKNVLSDNLSYNIVRSST